MTFDRIEMTQTIEQLTARVRELEEFKANVVKECASIIKHAHKDIAKQLAASQAYAEQLREALDVVSIAPLVNDFGLPKYGVSVSEMKLVQKALAIPNDTSALDAYVAEKVKEYADEARRQMQHATKAVWQRDLAVEALKAIAGRRIFIDNLASNVDIAVMTLDAIKESEEN